MKYKKHLIIFMFIVIVIVCYFSYINKNYTSYDVTIQGMIISNNGKQLVFEGFPQNPKGNRGTYIVINSNKLDRYNVITNSKIPFESLEEGDNIVIYYQDRVQTSKIRTGDMDELLSLTDNQKISDVKSITVFEPPLRHSVIPQE